VLVAGLSTQNKIALGVTAAIFIAFSLVSAFVAPRRNPDFPGRGAKVYYVACFALFLLMVGAVETFGVEEEEAGAAESGQTEASNEKSTTVDVAESEWRVQLPSSTSKSLTAGSYVFHVTNNGKIPHNLTVDGPGVEDEKTATIAPGDSADLHVNLETGSYDLYCSIPGHREQGMEAKLAVA
jgi:uncharacterized cupredoxin-like copper-binding protein